MLAAFLFRSPQIPARSFRLKRPQSEFHVQADALDPYRPPILVVRRIGDALQIEGREQAGAEPRAVIAFPDVFGRVVEPAIADEEVEAAPRQVDGMHARKSAGGEGSGSDIFFSPPGGSFERDSAARQPVDGREREVLGLAIIPAQAREEAGIARDLLFNVEARSVLESSWAVHGSDVRRGAGLRGPAQSIAVAAGVGVIQVPEQPDRAGTISQ